MPVELPPHLSYSQLSTFMSCGEKYKLERVDGHKGTPNWAAVGGSAVHQMTEQRDRLLVEHGVYQLPATRVEFETILEQCIVKEEELTGIDRSEFRHTGRKSKDWPDKWGYLYWLSYGPEWVNAWHQWCAMTPWRFATSHPVEYQFEIELGDTKVRGAIDRIMENADGDLVVVDIKTSAQQPKSPEQLGLYACAVELDMGVRPKYGAFWMARDGGTGPVFDLDRFSLDYMTTRYRTVRNQMTRGEFLPNPEMHCSYCSVKKHCSIMGD
jgi:RecB family exonuclease